jgi:hypothetical protein
MSFLDKVKKASKSVVDAGAKTMLKVRKNSSLFCPKFALAGVFAAARNGIFRVVLLTTHRRIDAVRKVKIIVVPSNQRAGTTMLVYGFVTIVLFTRDLNV